MPLRSLKPAKSNRPTRRGAASLIYPSPLLLLTLLAPALFASAAQAQDRAADRWDRCAAFGPDFAPIESSDNCARLGGHVRVPFGPNSGWSETANDGPREGRLPAGPAHANFNATAHSIEAPASRDRVLLRPRAFGGL